MNKPILVTGASGFIGSHLTRALEAAGHSVYRHSAKVGNIASCPLEYKGVQHVYHLAAKTFVPDSWISPLGFYETNVMGTINVLEFCRREGASATMVSSYIYGKPDRLPIGEDHPVRPSNPYSHTKILCEQATRYYVMQFGVTAAIVRPFNIYGPGQESRFLVPKLIRQMIDPVSDGIAIADPRPRRDYIYVSDLVTLLIAMIGVGGAATFNAGSGESFSIGHLVGELRLLTGIDKPLRASGERRPEEVLDVVADVSKAKRELRWSPQVSLRDGLSKTIEWMRSHGDQR